MKRYKLIFLLYILFITVLTFASCCMATDISVGVLNTDAGRRIFVFGSALKLLSCGALLLLNLFSAWSVLSFQSTASKKQITAFICIPALASVVTAIACMAILGFENLSGLEVAAIGAAGIAVENGFCVWSAGGMKKTLALADDVKEGK